MDRYQEFSELLQKWTPPKEVAGAGQREVKLTRSGIVIAVMAGVMMVGGVGAAIGLQLVGMRESGEAKELSEHGQDAQATITRLWRANDKERRPMVGYQFEVDGRMYRRSVHAPLHIWRNLKEGETLTVRYLPIEPIRNHPRDWASAELPWYVAVLAGGSLMITGGMLVWVLMRQISLLRDGRPAPGIVTKHSFAGHGQKAYHYEFALLSGSPGKGRSRPSRKVPDIGSTICVLYDRENPRRNTPYPMETVKIAQ
ncbi:MAG TPA: DUF3592 domain-containing protein [Bryobacteraceae bacterium]|nr:DUF3592 domain-containing protein [Bryobacteraceae bacterium]